MIQTVSFVIPVKNDAKRLETCLKSLSRLAAPGIRSEVIVLDNGSTDNSAEVASRMGAIVQHAPELSVAELRNRGAFGSEGGLIAFVDADHILAEQWLVEGMKALLEQDCGIAGAPYSIPQQATWVQRAYDRFRRHPEKRMEVEWLGSGNMLVRRDLFIELQGFSEFLETCEDVDLCQRAREKGWRVLADPGMKSIHLGDPATLRNLFFGELWRGRNNLRVTLGGPLSFSAFLSLAIPILNLLGVGLIGIGMIQWVLGASGRMTMLAGALIVIILTALRSSHMSRNDATPRSIAENSIVALIYNLARAFALVTKASHKARRCA